MVFILSIEIIAFILSVILGLLFFLHDNPFFKKLSNKTKTISFVAGVSVTYVFLFLLPDLYEAVGHLNRWIFILVLIGFSLVHFSEKYLYQHLHGSKRSILHQQLHFLVFFIYYFLVGIILAFLLEESRMAGLLFYIPLVFYTVLSKLHPLKDKTHPFRQNIFRYLLPLAPILGVLAAPSIAYQLTLYHSLLALVVGSFLYIALMDFIPAKGKGQPLYFLIGASIYTLLIALTWAVG